MDEQEWIDRHDREHENPFDHEDECDRCELLAVERRDNGEDE